MSGRLCMSEPGRTSQVPPPSLFSAQAALASWLPAQTNQLQNEEEKVDDVQVDVQGSEHILFGVQVGMNMAPPHHQLHIHHQVLEEKEEQLAA